MNDYQLQNPAYRLSGTQIKRSFHIALLKKEFYLHLRKNPFLQPTINFLIIFFHYSLRLQYINFHFLTRY